MIYYFGFAIAAWMVLLALIGSPKDFNNMTMANAISTIVLLLCLILAAMIKNLMDKL